MAGVFQGELGRTRQALIKLSSTLMQCSDDQEVLTTWTPFGSWWWPARPWGMATCLPRQFWEKSPWCSFFAVSSISSDLHVIQLGLCGYVGGALTIIMSRWDILLPEKKTFLTNPEVDLVSVRLFVNFQFSTCEVFQIKTYIKVNWSENFVGIN